jgi:hypothetical protein
MIVWLLSLEAVIVSKVLIVKFIDTKDPMVTMIMDWDEYFGI